MENRKDKNIAFRILWAIIIVWIIGLIVFWINRTQEEKYFMNNGIKFPSEKQFKDTIGVVMEVQDNGLIIAITDIYGNEYMRKSKFGKAGNIGFKKGQEVRVSYEYGEVEGFKLLHQVVKDIEIINKNSMHKVPISLLRKYYYYKEKVYVNIEEFTNTGITYTIIDNNELPYNYGNGISYKIQKKVRKSEKEEYYIEERKSDISWIDTIEETKDVDEHTFKRKYNWEKLYGRIEKRRI